MEKQFKLPEKKVRVSYIKRKKGMAVNVPDDHVIAGGMLNQSFKKIPVPKLKNGSLANVLTKEEKQYLESEEGLNIRLSVYSNRDFWANKYVTLRKGDNILDLSDPIDYIDYKILLGNTELVAPSIKERDNKLTYLFVIVDDEEVQEIEKNQFNYKKQAFKLYSQVEDNREILRGVLKILNSKPVSAETSMSWLQGEVEKIVDNRPKAFVNLLEDSNYETKILLSALEDAGLVIFRNKRYTTSDGIELAYEGEIASYDNTVKFLADPKNVEILDHLKAKLDKIEL